MKNQAGRTAQLPGRRGVTLVELIVAMTILTVGLLGFVASSAYLTRGLIGANNDTVAGVIGQSGLEELAGTACLTVPLNQVNQTVTRGITRRSRVTNNGNNTLLVLDSLSWKARGKTRVATFLSIMPCRPGA
jgi:prepilin-type N-terminal cleavage/methylation domain-containing protein